MAVRAAAATPLLAVAPAAAVTDPRARLDPEDAGERPEPVSAGQGGFDGADLIDIRPPKDAAFVRWPGWTFSFGPGGPDEGVGPPFDPHEVAVTVALLAVGPGGGVMTCGGTGPGGRSGVGRRRPPRPRSRRGGGRPSRRRPRY